MAIKLFILIMQEIYNILNKEPSLVNGSGSNNVWFINAILIIAKQAILRLDSIDTNC